MAYPPPRDRDTSAKPSFPVVNPETTTTTDNNNSSSSTRFSQPCHNNDNDSVTTASVRMDEAPPQSMLSLSTHASSVSIVEKTSSRRRLVKENLEEKDDDEEIQRRATSTCCGSDPKGSIPFPQQQQQQQQQQHPNGAAMYIEKLYENTVHGPCHVTMCEVEHMDLFMVRKIFAGTCTLIQIGISWIISYLFSHSFLFSFHLYHQKNCQQPLSFLGFGHHPGSAAGSVVEPSFHNDEHHHYHEEEELPLPGAYAVPQGCEYCGAVNTSDCDNHTCPRPKLFFHKKRPPFAKPDATKWDPDTGLFIVSRNTTTKTTPTPHNQRNF